MDLRNYQSLQEAYLEIIMNEGKIGIDDTLPSGKKTPRQKMRTKASNLDKDANIAGAVASSPSWRTPRAIRLGAKEQESSFKERAKKIREVEKQLEQVDTYDLILFHLLDEGYAETPEAAEVMMVNMSEEWRESIMEGKKSKKKTQEQKDAETREKWYGEKAIKAGTDRFSQLQKAALKSARTRLF